MVAAIRITLIGNAQTAAREQMRWALPLAACVHANLVVKHVHARQSLIVTGHYKYLEFATPSVDDPSPTWGNLTVCGKVGEARERFVHLIDVAVDQNCVIPPSGRRR
ncbi:hypothetical protein [Mycolicibacter icosiumassiliensis]|uniref:hypothetical protein n=1 Tax=Mycolicibacter icosiumassiliensis TaxID=1792835 RepID=UPI000A7A8F92|nr:hypothetical protein [Mycolicibacter icosiumassiliensis]